MRIRVALAVVAAMLVALMPSVAFAAESTKPPVKLETISFVDTLTCGQSIEKDDRATGRLSLRFECFGDAGRVTWGFKMSPQVRARIASGFRTVREDGMIWFQNGVRKPKNAQHVQDPTYHYHGTLPGLRPGDRAEYQDYFECETADGYKLRLAFAGTLYLKP